MISEGTKVVSYCLFALLKPAPDTGRNVDNLFQGRSRYSRRSGGVSVVHAALWGNRYAGHYRLGIS